MESQGRLAVTNERPAEPAVPLRLVDRLMLGYLGIAIVVAITRIHVKPWATWFIGAYLLVALLVFLVHRPGLGGFGRVLRTIYPIVILPSLYGSLDLVNGFEIPVWDRVIQGWEMAIFGGQVSRTWWQSAPSVFWSTVFHAVYFVYYFIVPFPMISSSCDVNPRGAHRGDDHRGDVPDALPLLPRDPGRRALLRVPPAHRPLHGELGGTPGLCDAGQGQFLRRGLPLLARRRHLRRNDRRPGSAHRRWGWSC